MGCVLCPLQHINKTWVKKQRHMMFGQTDGPYALDWMVSQVLTNKNEEPQKSSNKVVVFAIFAGNERLQ